MASKTFDNLPPDKRERFIAVALEEFATHSYDQASISRIVAKLGIAKGSVYQYFKDKVGLYLWLVEEAGRRELEWHSTHQPSADTVFSERVRSMYTVGLEWVTAEPRWARVALRATEASREPRLETVRRVQLDQGHAWLVGFLEQALANGDIRSDLPLDIVASLLSGMFIYGMIDALMRRGDTDFHHLVNSPDMAQAFRDIDVEAIVETGLVLLLEGVGPRQTGL